MGKITKAFPAFISKVNATPELGVVGAFVAIMGNIDYGDDIIVEGAFTKTISERAHKIKILDNHNSWSALDAIGKLLTIQEIGKEALPPELLLEYPDATGGLYVEIQFILEEPSDESAKMFRRIKHGIIDEYSIGYDIVKSEVQEIETDEGKRNILLLREIKLWEISPVIFAMNPATTTVDTKNDEPEIDDTDIVLETASLPDNTKAIPEGYRMAADSAMCMTCVHFRSVTKNLGYCRKFDTTVTANYVSDGYELKDKVLRDIFEIALLEFLSVKIAEYSANGVWSADDVRTMEEMLDNMVAAFFDLIPDTLLSSVVPIMTTPKSLDIQDDDSTQAEADPEKGITLDDDRLSRLLSQRQQIIDMKKLRRESHANSN